MVCWEIPFRQSTVDRPTLLFNRLLPPKHRLFNSFKPESFSQIRDWAKIEPWPKIFLWLNRKIDPSWHRTFYKSSILFVNGDKKFNGDFLFRPVKNSIHWRFILWRHKNTINRLMTFGFRCSRLISLQKSSIMKFSYLRKVPNVTQTEFLCAMVKISNFLLQINF